MANGTKKPLIHRWWANLILTLAFLAAAYGAGSWAIDSGSMWAYGLTILFLVWTINRGVAGVRYARAH